MNAKTVPVKLSARDSVAGSGSMGEKNNSAEANRKRR